MKFYDILQLDPRVHKEMIRESSLRKDKFRYFIGMVLRSILIVLFAILFITTLSTLFGNDNTPMAVVLFCVLMAVRFIDFGYRVGDSLVNLGVVFLILLISPVLATSCFPLIGLIINLVSFFTIIFITCDSPEMGNGGLFGFAYIYLSGNTVFGEILLQRFFMTLVGFAICGLIFFFKHRDKNIEIRFVDKIRHAKITQFKIRWMIKLCVGVCLMLFIGIAFGMDRFIWAGFACNSLLCVYSPEPMIKERFIDRILGVIIGSVAFFAICYILPDSLHTLIGPLGGFCLGFCVDYKYKTAMNSMGALMIASSIYGIEYSIFLRLTNTIIGLVFTVAFLFICDCYASKRFGRKYF